MVRLKLLNAHAFRPDVVDCELFAYFTTFSTVPLVFVGSLEGLRGRLIDVPKGEELAGGQSQTLAARLWLLPCTGNYLQIRQFQVQNAGTWIWLVRNSEFMTHRIWDTVPKGEFL